MISRSAFISVFILLVSVFLGMAPQQALTKTDCCQGCLMGKSKHLNIRTGKCVESCPDDMQLLQMQNICFKQQSQCPGHYNIRTDTGCHKCSASKPLYNKVGKSCVSSCPSYTKKVNNKCIFNVGFST